MSPRARRNPFSIPPDLAFLVIEESRSIESLECARAMLEMRSWPPEGPDQRLVKFIAQINACANHLLSRELRVTARLAIHEMARFAIAVDGDLREAFEREALAELGLLPIQAALKRLQDHGKLKCESRCAPLDIEDQDSIHGEFLHALYSVVKPAGTCCVEDAIYEFEERFPLVCKALIKLRLGDTQMLVLGACLVLALHSEDGSFFLAVNEHVAGKLSTNKMNLSRTLSYLRRKQFLVMVSQPSFRRRTASTHILGPSFVSIVASCYPETHGTLESWNHETK